MAKRKNPKRTTKVDSTPESTKSDSVDATAVDVSDTPVDIPEIDAEPLETKGYDKFAAKETTGTATEIEASLETTIDAEHTEEPVTEVETEVVETPEIVDESPQPEREHEHEPAQLPETVLVQPEPARASVLPLILAGVLTAILGFLAARSDLLPESLRASAPEADPAIAEGLADVNTRLTALEATVAALPEPQPPVGAQAPAAAAEVDLDPINTQISDLFERTDTIEPLTERLNTLTERVDAFAAQPQADVTIPQDALNAALAELRETASNQEAEIDKQQAEINGLLADAREIRTQTEAEANATLQRAALAQITTAVDTGSPFAPALDDLEKAGATDVPDALKSTAEEGVVSLAALQASYPDAARSALAAARTNSEESSGIGGFFQRQLGTRSVEPREGSDADAVLSRMGAAVSAGQLNDALTEAEQLSDPARDAMATWLEQAQSRYDAVTAAKTLADRLSAL